MKMKSPLEWLADKTKTWSAVELYQELMYLASRVGAEVIEDVYRSDMVEDGYFDDWDDLETR